MNKNYAFLNSFTKISEETFSEVKSIAGFKRIESGTQIVKTGEVPSKVYLLISGVMRCYIRTESGKEFNKSFYLPSSFVASLTALIKRKPSKLIFEALTDCKIYEIDYYKLLKLKNNNLAISRLYSKILEIVYIKYEKRLMELITLDAKDRYLELRKQIPEVDKLISQYHIASYLGITAVQLSRIRKKLA